MVALRVVDLPDLRVAVVAGARAQVRAGRVPRVQAQTRLSLLYFPGRGDVLPFLTGEGGVKQYILVYNVFHRRVSNMKGSYSTRLDEQTLVLRLLEIPSFYFFIFKGMLRLEILFLVNLNP